MSIEIEEIVNIYTINNIIDIINQSLNLFNNITEINKLFILSILPQLKNNIKIIDTWIFENTPEFNSVSRTNYISIFNHINERQLPGENILPLLSYIFSLEYQFKQDEIDKLIKCSKIKNLDDDIINSDIWTDNSKYDFTCYVLTCQFKGLLKLFTEKKQTILSCVSQNTNYTSNSGFA